MLRHLPFRALATCAVALLAVGLSARAEEKTEVFKVAKDTFITNEKAGTPGDRTDRNFGDQPQINIDTQYNGEKSHALVQFDLAAIPAEATIRKAVLLMGPRIKPGVGTLMELEVRRLLRDDWLEGGKDRKTEGVSMAATWNARFVKEDGTAVAWEMPGAMGATDSDVGTAIRLPGADAVARLDEGIDVTVHVQTWQKDRTVAPGWMLRSSNQNINYIRWASREAEGATGPTLAVTWE